MIRAPGLPRYTLISTHTCRHLALTGALPACGGGYDSECEECLSICCSLGNLPVLETPHPQLHSSPNYASPPFNLAAPHTAPHRHRSPLYQLPSLSAPQCTSSPKSGR